MSNLRSFVDTHCHINILAKNNFDVLLTEKELHSAQTIIKKAAEYNVMTLVNVGTSIIESKNCIEIAKKYADNYSVIGIHPNDISSNWESDITALKALLPQKTSGRIVGIGECGFDFHYPNYNKKKQENVFRAQIELALENNLALVVHSRDARDETYYLLEEYANDLNNVVLHCFSYDKSLAKQATDWGFLLGIGGTVTYPGNVELREIVKEVGLKNIVLESDAPFLPPQIIRGKKNHPRFIATVAEFIAELTNSSLSEVATQTTNNAHSLFTLNQYK